MDKEERRKTMMYNRVRIIGEVTKITSGRLSSIDHVIHMNYTINVRINNTTIACKVHAKRKPGIISPRYESLKKLFELNDLPRTVEIDARLRSDYCIWVDQIYLVPSDTKVTHCFRIHANGWLSTPKKDNNGCYSAIVHTHDTYNDVDFDIKARIANIGEFTAVYEIIKNDFIISMDDDRKYVFSSIFN